MNSNSVGIQQLNIGKISLLLNEEIDSCLAEQIVKHVEVCFKTKNKDSYQQCMRILVKLMSKGYGKIITKSGVIVQLMMDKFTIQFNAIQPDSKEAYKLMHLLSVIAQLIKQTRPITLTMGKKFIQRLLLVDEEFLENSIMKKDVLAVLAVMYQCISRQKLTLKKFELLHKFKRTVLSNYRLIEQQFTNRLFNRALYNLSIQGELVTEGQLIKYGVKGTLTKIIGEEQASILMIKLQSVLRKLNKQKTDKFNQLEQQRISIVAE